jgi:hypothetical protein
MWVDSLNCAQRTERPMRRTLTELLDILDSSWKGGEGTERLPLPTPHTLFPR